MRKRIALMFSVLCFFFMFFISNLKAQEWVGNATLASQESVDAFNYTSVTGDLIIWGFIGSIHNLNGLSKLVSVGKSLIIRNNPFLTNLDGLSSLKSVGDLGTATFESIALVIDNNQALINLDGLANLEEIEALEIKDNSSLTSIAALSVLTQDKIKHITIENNDALTNLDALSGLSQIVGSIPSINHNLTNLAIVNNEALNDLDGLSNITEIKGKVEIVSNPALLNLSLSSLQKVKGSLHIAFNNALVSLGSSNLKEIEDGYLDIGANQSLVNIDALSQLEKVSGDLLIGGNFLTNLNGLASLTEVGSLGFGETFLTNTDGLLKLKKISETLAISFNFNLTNLNGLANLEEVGKHVRIRFNVNLRDYCGLYNLFNSGTIGGDIEINTNGANTVAVDPPQNVTVNADPGLCSAAITKAALGTATAVGCLPEFATAVYDLPAGNIFPVGTTNITWTATDGAGNTATAIQTITVVDNQPPTITCSANITVKCASDVPDADINTVTVTDNCLAVISHAGDVVSNQTCANRFTLTRTYKVTDAGNNTATCAQVITVYDDIPPQITGFTASKQSLWPPNHTMRDVTLNYTASDNCVSTPVVTVTVSSNEPVNGTADGDTDPDWEIMDDHHIKLRAERAANGDGRIYTITVTVDDGCNPPVSQSKQVMVAHNITGPQSGKPFKVGSIVNFSGVFYDKQGNTHTAKWLLDGSAAVNGAVIEPSGNVNGKVSGSYKFNAPGVYKLQMNITDQTGITSYANTNNDLDAIVVIYDPNGGNTYGGGYFNSPAGALRSNPSATGKAGYGFAMNYFKNSTNPKGETQFEFKVGEFEFNALNFDYLVISNSMAQFKGTGKIIGGQSGVGFTMTVTDGQLDGSGVDKIRMKIYNKNNGSIIYDNQPGASDATLPTQAVGANSIIVISGTNSGLTSANTSQKGEMEIKGPEASINLDVIAFPNPSASNFTLNVSGNSNDKIIMQIIDMYGRIIESRNINANSPIRFGDRYNPGTYFVRILQGKEHKEIKLVKLSD